MKTFIENGAHFIIFSDLPKKSVENIQSVQYLLKGQFLERKIFASEVTIFVPGNSGVTVAFPSETEDRNVKKTEATAHNWLLYEKTCQ